MNTCPVCGQPLERYTQADLPGYPERQYEHCTRPGCDLYMVTLEAGEHATLNNERIDEYAAMNARLRSLT
jgi:hypothetical protein